MSLPQLTIYNRCQLVSLISACHFSLSLCLPSIFPSRFFPLSFSPTSFLISLSPISPIPSTLFPPVSLSLPLTHFPSLSLLLPPTLPPNSFPLSFPLHSPVTLSSLLSYYPSFKCFPGTTHMLVMSVHCVQRGRLFDGDLVERGSLKWSFLRWCMNSI